MTWQRAFGGLSCASSIAAAAYGSHALPSNPLTTPSDIKAWDVASRYQLLHSFALLSLPSVLPAAHPICCAVSSGLMAGGILAFSGSCYAKVLTKDERIGKITPYGGFALIAAWISIALLRR